MPDVVVSGDTCTQAKPSTVPMFYACEQIGVLPEKCLYVGDAQRDIQAGRDSGMTTVLAKWGYFSENDQPETWGADYAVDELLDIMNLV